MNKYTVYLKNRETITVIADEWKNAGDHMIFLKDHEEVARVNWDDFAALKKCRIFFLIDDQEVLRVYTSEIGIIGRRVLL